MHLNSTFELTLILDTDKFQKVFTRAGNKAEYVDDDKYVDQSLMSKGIIVTYRDKQYKKKIQLTVNANVILDGDVPCQDNADKLVSKLEKRINTYFGSNCQLDDFNLSKMYLITDIDVRSRENVSAYIKVLKRIGKVKGFSPSRDDDISGGIGFSLEGNSNGFAFRIYDLKGWLKEKLKEADSWRKPLKEMIDKPGNILRADVRLMKSQAFRACTDRCVASEQIADLCSKGQKIFLDVFKWIVPFGDFYKKGEAVDLICKQVSDLKTRRRMLRIVALLPEKKSLLLAQKALNYRRIDEVMSAFAYYEVAPVTISKRHDIKKLDNLYKYLLKGD